MKDQNKTRFEVGMNVVVLIEGWATKGTITTIHTNGFSPVVAEYINTDGDYDTDTFTLDGFRGAQDHVLSLYTAAEYEALKALTDSFVNGTFKKEQPKFEPQKDEPIMYHDTQYFVKHIEAWHTLQFPSGVSSVKGCHIKPVEGYEYANGFCIPLKEVPQDNPIVSTKFFETTEWGKNNEPTEKPTPISGEWKETIDLLDENGQPVYFEVGMKVGYLGTGMTGMVCRRDNSTKEVCVDFDSDVKWFTFDGKVQDSNIQAIYPIAQYNQIKLPKIKPIQVAKPKEDVIELIDNYNKKRGIGSIYVSTYIETIANKEVSDKFYYLIQKCRAYSIDKCSFYKCELIPTVSKKFVLNVGFVFDGKNHDLFIHLDDVNNHGINISYKKNGEIKAEIL